MEYIKLSDAADIITGFSFKSEKFNTNCKGIKLIRGKNVGKGFLHWGDDARYWDEDFPEKEKYSLKLDDIIIGMDGSNIGKNCAVIVKDDLPSLLVQRVARVRAKEGFEQNYLKCCILNSRFANYVNEVKTGTAIPHISGTQINNYMIPYYEYSIQHKIGTILNNITKKIELNNKINKNLEEYTKNLFESNILNNEERNNWREYVLSDFSKVINGYSYKGTELVDNSDIGLATIKNFERAGGFKLNGFKDISPEKYKYDHFINPFDVLVACTDLTQNADIIGNAIMLLNFSKYKKVIMSMDLIKLVPITDYIDNYILYSIVNSRDFKEFALGYKSGTTVLHLNKNCFKEYKIKLPDKNVLNELSKIIESNYKKIAQVIEENRNLSQLRDTLLPRLMNGEIDLSNVEV